MEKTDKDYTIRKVRTLSGTPYQLAVQDLKLDANDLVIVSKVVTVEKVEGDPVSFLLKRAGKEEERKI